MKRLYVCTALLILLAGLACLHTAKLRTLTGQLTAHLAQVDESLRMEDWEAASASALLADRQWEAQTFYLHITLHHEDIDAIQTSLKEMQAYLSSRDDAAECLAVNARLINQLALLLEAELPSLKNLL